MLFFYVLLHKHFLTTENLINNFKVLKKCRGKLKCMIFEMLLIKNKEPKLNTQADSHSRETFYMNHLFSCNAC